MRASIELFPTADGDVYLLQTGGAPALVVRRPDARDRRLLEQLAQEGVEAPARSDAAARLEPLAAQGLLVEDEPEEPLPPVEAERFSRQLDWLAELGRPLETQRRLRRAHVAVLGCGGLGTWALAAIASLGVGRLTLVDDDTVALSNLNRQILYGVDDVGRSKVECAAAWLARFDPDIEARVVHRRITAVGDLDDIVPGPDALVLAADWPAYDLGRWVNAACVPARAPFILAGQQPPVLKVGPTYAPGRGPCFRCHETFLARRFPLYTELTAHRRRTTAPAVTLGPTTGVIGTLVSLEVLALLASESPVPTLGRAMLLDMRTLDQRWEDIPRDPDCSACAALFDD